MAKNKEIKTIGIDISKDAIQQASTRRNILKINNLDYVIGNMDYLPFMNDSFNVLLNSFAPINEKEFQRVLKSNGYYFRVLHGKNPFRFCFRFQVLGAGLHSGLAGRRNWAVNPFKAALKSEGSFPLRSSPLSSGAPGCFASAFASPSALGGCALTLRAMGVEEISSPPSQSWFSLCPSGWVRMPLPLRLSCR